MAGSTDKEKGEFGFQIAPMVDVVFVLLLFFMACAGMEIKEGFIKVPLPGVPPPGGPPIVTTFIDIDEAGNVSVNGQILSASPKDRDLKRLQEHLTTVVQKFAEDPVVIRPSPEARHERFMDVLSVCRTAKVPKLTFG